jgi:hypothetical protein
MAGSTYYVQGCPTCGRRLNIRVEYLGRRVVCQHCHGPFEARDPSASTLAHCDPESELLQRANELLSSLESVTSRSKGHVPR